MTTRTIRLRHIMEWRLAIVAGLCAGVVFLLLNSIFAVFAWHIGIIGLLRYFASIVLGPGVLPPPSTFALVPVLVGLLVNFALSLIYAVILAILIHRWGLIVGVVGGALFGVAVYLINLYTFTVFFPWFFALTGPALLFSHILFGIVAGGTYELLDYDDSGYYHTRQVRS